SALNGEGRTLVVSSRKRALLIDVDKHARRFTLEGQANLSFPTISPDGRWVATGVFHGKDIWIWNAKTGKCEKQWPLRDARFAGWFTDVARTAFSPDGRWLVTSTLHEYDFYRVGSWEFHHRVPRDDPGELPGVMSFSGDSRMLAVAHSLDEVQLLDPETGSELATLYSPSPGKPNSLSFSQDGGWLAAGYDHTTQVWSLRRIREELAALGLDWQSPPRPPPPRQGDGLRARVDLGALAWYPLVVQAQSDEARGRWPEALAALEKANVLNANVPNVSNELAWFLATCPDEHLRDIPRSVKLARKALAAEQKASAKQRGTYWNTLGTALYRAGDWPGARDALTESMKLQGINAWDKFFLAMTHARLAQKHESNTHFPEARS